MHEDALRLHDAARQELAALHVAQNVDSTQDWALRNEPPARGAAVYVAHAQQAGRGRRGRAWVSPAGAALYVSVVRRFGRPAAQLGPLSLAVGVALARALHGAGLHGIGVKWPNDLWVRGRKLGGILVELRPQSEGVVAIIGFGINRVLPDDVAIDQAWTDLAREGLVADAEALLSLVLDALLPALAEFDREGFAPFEADWQRFDLLLGHTVRIVLEGAEQMGEVLGVSSDGGLRVRHAEGECIHHSGEVSVRVVA